MHETAPDADGTDDGWRVIGASVLGRGHERHGLPCQDAHATYLRADGVLAIVVADGAGSATHAERGATSAVEAAREALAAGAVLGEEATRYALLAAALRAARARLETLADAEQIPLRQLATTLCCALVAPGWVAAVQIGDGALVARRGDGALLSALPPHRGEHANETLFLTSQDALDRLSYHHEVGEISAVAAMSDGLVNLALERATDRPHPPFFEPLFTFVGRAGEREAAEAQLAAFLASERVCARTDDDKTLVLAARAAPPSAEPP